MSNSHLAFILAIVLVSLMANQNATAQKPVRGHELEQCAARKLIENRQTAAPQAWYACYIQEY